MVPSAVATGHQMIRASERHRADCALDRVGVERDPIVVEEPREAIQVAERVADRLGERVACGQLAKLCFEPRAQILHERCRQRPTPCQSLCGRTPAHLRLDPVDVFDPAQPFQSDGEPVCCSRA